MFLAVVCGSAVYTGSGDYTPQSVEWPVDDLVSDGFELLLTYTVRSVLLSRY